MAAMKTIWKVLLGLAVILPMGAFVTGALAASASDDPAPRQTIQIRQPDPSRTASPTPSPTRSPSPTPTGRGADDRTDDHGDDQADDHADDEVEVVTPDYDDLDDHGGDDRTDDHGGHGGGGDDD